MLGIVVFGNFVFSQFDLNAFRLRFLFSSYFVCGHNVAVYYAFYETKSPVRQFTSFQFMKDSICWVPVPSLSPAHTHFVYTPADGIQNKRNMMLLPPLPQMNECCCFVWESWVEWVARKPLTCKIPYFNSISRKWYSFAWAGRCIVPGDCWLPCVCCCCCCELALAFCAPVAADICAQDSCKRSRKQKWNILRNIYGE